MSAWQNNWEAAPRDGTQFLVRHDRWTCPSVVHYCIDADGFIFSEEALAEIDGGVVLPNDDLEWALLPE